MTEAKPAMSALRRRMIDDMTLRNLGLCGRPVGKLFLK